MKHHKELEIEDKKEVERIVNTIIKSISPSKVQDLGTISDNVNSPKHYNTGKVECIEAIEASMSKEEFLGYLRGSVIKYQWRCRYKGKDIEDVAKSIWYANLLKEKLGAYKHEE